MVGYCVWLKNYLLQNTKSYSHTVLAVGTTIALSALAPFISSQSSIVHTPFDFTLIALEVHWTPAMSLQMPCGHKPLFKVRFDSARYR